jgi:hypothetical protein
VRIADSNIVSAAEVLAYTLYGSAVHPQAGVPYLAHARLSARIMAEVSHDSEAKAAAMLQQAVRFDVLALERVAEVLTPRVARLASSGGHPQLFESSAFEMLARDDGKRAGEEEEGKSVLLAGMVATVTLLSLQDSRLATARLSTLADEVLRLDGGNPALRSIATKFVYGALARAHQSGTQRRARRAATSGEKLTVAQDVFGR